MFYFSCSECIQLLILKYFCRLLFYVTDTPLWLLWTVKASIKYEFYINYFSLLTFVLSSPYLTQSVRLPLAPYRLLCSTSITYNMTALFMGCYTAQVVTRCFPTHSQGGKRQLQWVTNVLSTCLY